MPGVGGYIVAFCVFLFGYTTLIGWAYYGEQFLEYMASARASCMPYRWIYCLLIPFGAVAKVEPRVGVGRPDERAAGLPEPDRRLLGLSGIVAGIARGRATARAGVSLTVIKAHPRQTGRPPALAVRARPRPTRLDRAEPEREQPRARNSHLRWHPLRGEWVAYAATASTARSCRRRNATRSRRDASIRRADGGAAGTVGGRGLREPVPDARRARPTIRPRRSSRTRPGRGALRGGRLHAGRRTRRSARCRSSTSSCSSRCGPTARASSALATDVAVRVPVREPRRRGGRDAAPPARADLRVPVRAAGRRARARPAARLLRAATGAACSRTYSPRSSHDGRAHPLRRRARGRVRAGVRALSVRGVDRAPPCRCRRCPSSHRSRARATSPAR